nr:MAG TPA: hypothetical protein [Caudoviricetes sp.]
MIIITSTVTVLTRLLLNLGMKQSLPLKNTKRSLALLI